MPRIIQSSTPVENTGRSIGSPTVFGTLPEAIQFDLLRGAITRMFTDGQSIWHHGDTADGFWIIVKGQVKVGRHSDSGEMRVLFMLGPGDSFGELALLGEFPRTADVEAVGELEMLWISDAVLSPVIASSTLVSGALIKVLSLQLQEAFSRLIGYRNMPAPKRLAHNLLALAEGKQAPIKIAIRQQELAELVGVSRMTIASALAQLEELGLVRRHYRHLILADPEALRRWMNS